MKTRCPDCQAVFRITPEQLKARAGKVRCGRCRTAFNALDNLLKAPQAPADAAFAKKESADIKSVNTPPSTAQANSTPPTFPSKLRQVPTTPVEEVEAVPEGAAISEDSGTVSDKPKNETPASPSPSSKAVVPPTTDGLILPRDTTEIPGYSKWSDGVMTAPTVIASNETSSRWPFKLTIGGLALILAGQVLFHFRGELAATTPALRPVLESFSLALGRPLPLPRNVDMVSIEASDLQIDPSRGKLLVLNATLRNKAPYEQAYPSLELALTDTQDSIIARRIIGPMDYLPAKESDRVFAGNTDIAVRLWIEAVDLEAAGYRLFVFYP